MTEKITPEEVQALIRRMSNPSEPSAKQLVAGIKRFRPDDLAKVINDRLPRTPRAPRRPSTASRVKAAVKAAKAAGIDVHTVEIDGVKVTPGNPVQPHEEPNEWDEVLLK